LAGGVTTLRKRAAPGGTLAFRPLARNKSHDLNAWTDTSQLWSFSPGTQITVSEGHPFHSQLRSGADLGGDFYTNKSYFAGKPYKANKRFVRVRYSTFGDNKAPYTTHEFRGPVLPGTQWRTGLAPNWPPSAASSNSTLDRKGAEAIARCAPTNSVADVSTFLGELIKDGLPSMVGSQVWKSKTQAELRRNAAGEYLNLQFGLKPILNDITKFTRGVTHANAVLEQYERDAGRVVRRRYNFPIERSTEQVILSTNAYPEFMGANSGIYTGGTAGRVTRTRETVRRTWFSGAFTYHLPSGYDSRKALERYALLADRLGATPSLETLWEVAPWSWAVDWFTNAGDVLSNVSDFAVGGLVMRYGYLMEHTIVKDTYTLSGSTLNQGTYRDVASPLTLVTETKQRRQANPFGFGITWSGLSPFQSSILAALGITKRGR